MNQFTSNSNGKNTADYPHSVKAGGGSLCGKPLTQYRVTPQIELIELIKQMHPGALVSPLSDWSKKESPADIWLRGEESTSTGCFKLFSSIPNRAGYEAEISTRFVKWLNKHGWHLECYEYGSYHLTLDSNVPHWPVRSSAPAPVGPFECPF